MKKIYILVTVIISTAALYFYFLKKDEVIITQTANTQTNKTDISSTAPKARLSKEDHSCEKIEKDLSSDLVENKETLLWNNRHYRFRGEVFRVRYFYDDGPNGQYKKTILYKENSEGFPLIEKTFTGFETSEIKMILDEGEVIWQEQAYSVDKKSIFWRRVDRKLVEVQSNSELICKSSR